MRSIEIGLDGKGVESLLEGKKTYQKTLLALSKACI